MRKNISNFLGLLLIFIGITAIIHRITGFNLWNYLFPTLLVLIGLFLIFKPKFITGTGASTIQFIGEIEKTSHWIVQSQEMWMFVGDIKLDFREAQIPDGLSELHIFGFVNDIRIIQTPNAAFAYKTNAIISDNRINNQKNETFLNTFEVQDPNFDTSLKKVKIQSWAFVNETRIES